ncbi:hypothetical protein EYF80_003301 [Liparis tanakae]|uniref:Uncharacterized protein n=1 Tax=Liparis tanakae TaxID=230148 RepID=A0A4Z2J9D3_9TELE|nr:hypothetical protein EYF80_003301 [Liparis tanakae]
MGFPTRACMEFTSDEAMKQSLRLVRDVSLSMSWNAESLPAKDTEVASILHSSWPSFRTNSSPFLSCRSHTQQQKQFRW